MFQSPENVSAVFNLSIVNFTVFYWLYSDIHRSVNPDLEKSSVRNEAVGSEGTEHQLSVPNLVKQANAQSSWFFNFVNIRKQPKVVCKANISSD